MGAAERASWREENRVLVAVCPDEERAKVIVKRLIDGNFQMDMICVLGKVHAVGDDPIGVYKLKAGERMMEWGKHGALWGGLWGMLVGAAGLFVFPVVGTVAAAGYIVEALAGGAAMGGGALAGAAALSQLTLAFHRSGIPDEKIQALHEAIENGKYLVMLRGATSEVEQSRPLFEAAAPEAIQDFPYARLIDKA